jgi:hypothetical protein
VCKHVSRTAGMQELHDMTEATVRAPHAAAQQTVQQTVQETEEAKQ